IVSAETRKLVAEEIQLLNAATSGQAVKQAACRQLSSLGGELPPALAELMIVRKTTLPPELYADVLPGIDPKFALLSRMEVADVTPRRRAAGDLRLASAQEPLSDLALLRLAELVTPESDAIVWQEVEQLLANEPREPAVRIHYAALNHP